LIYQSFDERRKIMAREILVALKSEDRLSQMIPYIEKIAQSGMRVVFLLRFSPQPAFTASQHDSIELRSFEGALEETRFTKENGCGTSVAEQRLSAEHKVFLALEALRKRGVEITVDVYTGSLRRAMKRYTCKGDVHLIVMRRRRELVMDCIDKAFPAFGLFKHATFTPVLLLHPTHAA
jgi:hypothetical protein